MNQGLSIELDDKNVIVMKLLHYFITEKNYNPIILQGAENEIWLENMDAEYEIVRIVSNYIHNNEQFDFDIFKTKRIVKKIKKKTFTFNINTLSIFLDLGENVSVESAKNLDCIKVNNEKDLTKSSIIKMNYPDLSKKLKYSEEGIQLFMKITNDINKHNKTDAEKVDEVFKMKYPLITYILIAMNVIIYLCCVLFGSYDHVLDQFCIFAPLIRSGQYYRLLTGAFLHANILHLGFNCYALYVIGTQLESYLGRIKYLIIYLFSAITGALFSMLFGGNSASIGASGAIFGLMGSIVYFGYHYRVFLGNVVKSQIIPLILVNLLIGFMSNGIDNAAHIGGLIGGMLITMALGVKYKSTNVEKMNGWILTFIFLIFSIYMAFVYAA
ncbi:MAG: rhomboid family intramembrane serine protease [Bacilli bacterium]|nr:rhomboid family intramembrane serine protease [Bacilli bacterium]